MKKECEIVQDLLFGYNDETLRKSSKELVEKHLANCEECQDALKEIQEDTHKEEKKEKEIDYLKKINTKISKKNIIIKVVLILITVIILFNLLVLIKYENQKADLEIFISKEATQEEVENIRKKIESKYDGEIRFKTKEEYLEETRSNLSNKEYLVDGWEEDNPFRDAFVIQVNARQEEEILENLKYVEGVGITTSQVSRNPYEYFIRLLINKLR